MRTISLTLTFGAAVLAAVGLASLRHADGGYRVAKQAKVGGDGGFDYVYADSNARRLYVARSGQGGHISIFNLDTLAPAGDIKDTRAHGAASDAATHHAFASSKPVAMWDSKTLDMIKTIPVDGNPDGLLNDDFNHRTYIFSHSDPNVTVIDDKDGTVLGTIDLGAAPEQAVTDMQGHVYVDLEDKGSVAVIDAKTMKVTGNYDLGGKGGGNAGLAIDAKNHVLFVACREPQAMVMIDSLTGKYLADLPIGRGCDGAVFNPGTMECFSAQGDGTLTVIKETSPVKFEIEQTVKTMTGAKTLTLDPKTNRILLIAAEYGAAAAPAAAGGRQRRGPIVPGSFSIIVVSR